VVQLLNIYPNPSKNIINLTVSSKDNEKVELSILNLEGKKITSVYQYIHKGTKTLHFNISHLPAGNYFVKIENDNVHLIDKFVKE